jgi:hypothetical protein
MAAAFSSFLKHRPCGHGTFPERFWHEHREIILQKDIKHEMPRKITHEKVVAHIGTKPVKLDEIRQPPV